MQLPDSIDAIRHPFSIPVAPGIVLDRFVYSFIIYDEDITLVDTGVAGCEERIFEDVISAGRDPSEIEQIILTHSHPDHIGGALAVQKRTGCSILAHSAEREWIENVDIQNRERPVPGFDSLVGGSVKLDRILSDGDIVDPEGSGSPKMRVIHTPGHSSGSISLFMQSTGALFSGDAIPVSGDLPVYDDALASVRSIKRLLELPGIRFLFQSWEEPKDGPEAYSGMERALQYLQIIHETVTGIADAGIHDPVELTRKAAEALNLPPQAVSPLLARTFASNLRIRNRKNLLKE